MLEEYWELSPRVLQMAREQDIPELIEVMEDYCQSQDPYGEYAIFHGIEYGLKFPMSFLRHVEEINASDPIRMDLGEAIDELREYMGVTD